MRCLHQAAKDFLVEFFQDSYVLTTHAHRVTVMPWDINSLKLLRFRSIQKLVAAWEALTQDNVWEDMLILSCKVSKQDNGHSCWGWRVLENTELLLECIYDEKRKSARNLADYLNVYVEVFRMTMIQNMINLVETHPLGVPEAFIPPQPRPQPRPPPCRYEAAPQPKTHQEPGPASLRLSGHSTSSLFVIPNFTEEDEPTAQSKPEP
ncbi:hypothetical protein L7F22_027704 [Adiantum nelumboides]|nr:hypothetical protein [Adiantum nelumboides]